MSKENDIEALRLQEVALVRQLAELREKLAKAEKGKGRSSDGVRPLRDMVLDNLAEAGCALNSLLLASIARPLHGREIQSTRFGTLSNDEAKSYDSRRPRPVYLCHCLTYDHGQAVKRYWARSDWPLSSRIMGPMTGRLLFLRGAAWTIGLARTVGRGERSADNPEILNFVAADQARDAGLSVKRGEFPFEDWLAEIDSAIERFDEEDRATREESAKFLSAHLSDRDQLFGSRHALVSLPGSSSTWRSGLE
ncbi:hypothetical protein [Rhizobium binxianense]|uniref:hypothetical protein n=1 Tax=Rhizobium binxianense TaxID=3024242 RepID=UPI002361C7EF|nr:hypothetical protein [Rhizobium sp. MJ37]MDC9834952.1 hypothetical protein [Rhizobium sp. MJ37]